MKKKVTGLVHILEKEPAGKTKFGRMLMGSATVYADFIVKTDNRTVYIVETKGREEDDDKLKFERLQKWCEDVNERQSRVVYKALYIKQE